MRKVVFSGMLGNALEWLEYALYAQFANIISEQFFPASNDEYIPIIATFGVFAAGFIVRPIGAIIFGYIGDMYGRKTALSLAILLMSVPTACISILPTYEQIGIMAPILLTLIRLLQGLSLGGEFSGCIAYVVEHSPIEHRGLAGSSAFVSMCLGMLMGSLIATFMSSVLSPEDLRAWGWRVPFALGIVIGGLGLYIRLHLSESPVYVQARKANALSKTPLRDIFKHYPKEFLTAVGLYLTVTVPFYTVTIFVNSYMQKNLGFSVHESVLINSIVLTTMIIAMPISAYFSDIIGRKKILVVSCVSTLLLIYPIFWLLHLKTFQSALVSQVALALIVSTYMGPMPTTLVEMFPTKIRFTGVALSYNISAGLLGGTMPMIAMYFIHKYKCDHFVSYYIMFFAILSLIALKFYKETFKKHLIDHY